MTDYQKLCKKDCYNFISPYGLGDTLMLCGFHKAWEEKNKGKIHFIIQPSHEIVMKMYGIKNYTLLKFEREEIRKNLNQIKASEKPTIGHIYLAHPLYHPEMDVLIKIWYDKKITFKELYTEFLQIDKNTKFEMPLNYPELTPQTEQKYGTIKELSNSVIVCPEAKSVRMFEEHYWQKIVKQYLKKGYRILCNCLDGKNLIKGCEKIAPPLEELLAIAPFCHQIISLRSGVCDLLAMGGAKQVVYYSSEEGKKQYSLKYIAPSKNIKELISPKQERKTNNHIKIYLFGFIPFLKIKEKAEKRHILLFGAIPLYKIRRKEAYVKHYLFGFLPIFKLKKSK